MSNSQHKILVLHATGELEGILVAETSKMRYKIDSENGYIASGSNCRVFLAYDLQNQGRKVAIKIAYYDNRHLRELFEKEAEFFSKPENQHPNIVGIYGYHESSENHPVLIMEYVPFTLEDKLISSKKAVRMIESIRRATNHHQEERGYGGKFDPKEVIGIIEPVCIAADHLHEKGIVHKGIKPSNILIAEGGTVKLSDISLDPKFLDIDSERYLVDLLRRRAPEGFEIEGREILPSSDLYSIAVVAFEILTRTMPFLGTFDPSKVLAMKKDVDYIQNICREYCVPEELARVLVKGMHPDHKERYQSGKEFVDALKSQL